MQLMINLSKNLRIEIFVILYFRQDINMLKDPNQPVFEEKWLSMRPTILKLLRQEAVTRAEWHDLFWLVHSVCLWDDKVTLDCHFLLNDFVNINSSGTSKSVRCLEGGYP